MSADKSSVKAQIVAALEHPEAEEGLYFRNFFHLHEEDERPAVEADQVSVLDALKELIAEGRVAMEEAEDEAIFRLVPVEFD
jgi:hypothetical protein